jgi:hypothetical protein
MLTMRKVQARYRLVVLDENIIGEIEYKKQSRWDGTLWLDGITLHRHAHTAQDTLEMLKTAHYWHLKDKHREALRQTPIDVAHRSDLILAGSEIE